MKYLKLFENFNQSEIVDICKKYGIKNYTINPDGSIDVDGDVWLVGNQLKELPLKFNRIIGDFNCIANRLNNLKGCPNYVGGFFDCSGNNLTSLIGCPKEIGDEFSFSNNDLTTLEGYALETYIINHDIIYHSNPIAEIIDLFNESVEIYLDYQETFNFVRNDCKVVKHLLEAAFEDFNEYTEQNIKIPKEIKGYTYI
jgi:hypothetical protein